MRGMSSCRKAGNYPGCRRYIDNMPNRVRLQPVISDEARAVGDYTEVHVAEMKEMRIFDLHQ